MALASAVTARHERVSLARRMRLIELAHESWQTSQDDMAIELKRMANSKKMQDVRAATEHTSKSKPRSSVISSEPDAAADPEAWRAWMNSQIRPMAKPQ